MCLEEPMCKPAVPRCGHAACFWCVHRAMDHFCASACPTCRRPFEHLPDVCVPLHRFLARAFPVEYARRLRETHEEEETKECFSPSPALDLDLGALRLTDKKDHDDDDDDAKNASPLAFFDALERAPAVRGADDPVLERVFLCGFSDDRTDGPDSEHAQKHARRGHAARDPVVLTRGHAACATCVEARLDFRDDRDATVAPEAPEEPDPSRRRPRRDRCPVCDARVVGNAPPAVCLPLRALTRAFAGERRGDGEDAGVPVACSDPPTARAESPSRDGPPAANGTLAERFLQVTGDARPDAFAHRAVGCDGCGEYPIRGRRFTCADCSSTAMGFDLCARCYESLHAGAGTKTVRGRFNQNHTGEHAMREVAPAPTVMHFLTGMHPDLTPAQILDLARRAQDEPEDGEEPRDAPREPREGEEAPREAPREPRGEET